MSVDSPKVRIMDSRDVEAVAELCRQLGYTTTSQEVIRRLAALSASPGDCLFIAEIEGRCVAWAQVCSVSRLQSDGYAEIGGIVVAPEWRRLGIGRRLLGECEAWAREAGFARLRLRSGVQRDEAHQLYERAGYERKRASYAFEKGL